jgi:transposase InsO family protein
MEGGQKTASFPRKPISDRETKPYARLHIDIAGPRASSLGGAKYFTVMVDEATQYYWVFTHRSKDASPEVVMETISGFIRDGHRVKSVKSDRDPAYMSQKFQTFLSRRSIEHHPTSGYTPQEGRKMGVQNALLV